MSESSNQLTANENQLIVFPQMKGDKVEKYQGALNVGGNNFDIELSPQDSSTGKPYLRLSGKCRDGETTITGALFEGKSKHPKAPCLTGPLEINKSRPDEAKFYMSLWSRESKKDKKPFLSGNVEKPRAPQES